MAVSRSLVRAVGALALTPLVALAAVHARLTASVPSAGATVAAPKELRLTFSERVEVAISRVTLRRGTEAVAALGSVAADPQAPQTLIVPVSGALMPGAYTVQYRVAGRDGHPMGGSYTFTVK